MISLSILNKDQAIVVKNYRLPYPYQLHQTFAGDTYMGHERESCATLAKLLT